MKRKDSVCRNKEQSTKIQGPCQGTLCGVWWTLAEINLRQRFNAGTIKEKHSPGAMRKSKLQWVALGNTLGNNKYKR